MSTPNIRLEWRWDQYDICPPGPFLMSGPRIIPYDGTIVGAGVSCECIEPDPSYTDLTFELRRLGTSIWSETIPSTQLQGYRNWVFAGVPVVVVADQYLCVHITGGKSLTNGAFAVSALYDPGADGYSALTWHMNQSNGSAGVNLNYLDCPRSIPIDLQLRRITWGALAGVPTDNTYRILYKAPGASFVTLADVNISTTDFGHTDLVQDFVANTIFVVQDRGGADPKLTDIEIGLWFKR